MDVFDLRKQAFGDYANNVSSFVTPHDHRLRARVDADLTSGALWIRSLLQPNPTPEPGEALVDLSKAGELHPGCLDIFRAPTRNEDGALLRQHSHQTGNTRADQRDRRYVLTSTSSSCNNARTSHPSSTTCSQVASTWCSG